MDITERKITKIAREAEKLVLVHSCTYNYYSKNKAFVKRIVLSLAQKTTKCMRPMRTAVFHSHIQTENFPFGLKYKQSAILSERHTKIRCGSQIRSGNTKRYKKH